MRVSLKGLAGFGDANSIPPDSCPSGQMMNNDPQTCPGSAILDDGSCAVPLRACTPYFSVTNAPVASSTGCPSGYQPSGGYCLDSNGNILGASPAGAIPSGPGTPANALQQPLPPCPGYCSIPFMSTLLPAECTPCQPGVGNNPPAGCPWYCGLPFASSMFSSCTPAVTPACTPGSSVGQGLLILAVVATVAYILESNALNRSGRRR
jgi:hypothetical protein